MSYLDEIESRVRADGAAWHTRFRRHEGAWQCLLLPSQRISEADYRILCARFSATAKPATTPEDRLRNKLRAHAARVDRLGQP